MSSGLWSLDHTTVVLNEPQNLVNIALVIRAMKNMGLSKLRLVRPHEFDGYRITGIAHDTEDVVERVEIFDDLPSALADSSYVLAATARPRSSRQDWWTPEDAARTLIERVAPVTLLFGPEDRGLSNEALDLCHGAVSIPANPDHTSMNLGHAAVVLFYEWRKRAIRFEGGAPADLSPKKSRQSPRAAHGEIEEFFDRWEAAMTEVGLFDGLDPIPKMRSFRSIFQRSDMDRRDVGLMEAAAYEILKFAAREKRRALERARADLAAEESGTR